MIIGFPPSLLEPPGAPPTPLAVDASSEELLGDLEKTIPRLGLWEIIGALAHCKTLVIVANPFISFFFFISVCKFKFSFAADSDRAVSLMHCRSYINPIGPVLHLAKVDDERVLHFRLQIPNTQMISDFRIVFHVSIKEEVERARNRARCSALWWTAATDHPLSPQRIWSNYYRVDWNVQNIVHLVWSYFDRLHPVLQQVGLSRTCLWQVGFSAEHLLHLNLLTRGSTPPVTLDAWSMGHVAWWRRKSRLTIGSLLVVCS